MKSQKRKLKLLNTLEIAIVALISLPAFAVKAVRADTSTPTPVASPVITVEWTLPTTRTNGVALAQDELKELEILCQGSQGTQQYLTTPQDLSLKIPVSTFFQKGTVQSCKVRVTDTLNQTSPWSQNVSVTRPEAPSAPAVFKITIQIG